MGNSRYYRIDDFKALDGINININDGENETKYIMEFGVRINKSKKTSQGVVAKIDVKNVKNRGITVTVGEIARCYQKHFKKDSNLVTLLENISDGILKDYKGYENITGKELEKDEHKSRIMREKLRDSPELESDAVEILKEYIGKKLPDYAELKVIKKTTI